MLSATFSLCFSIQSFFPLVNSDPKYLNFSNASNLRHFIGIYVVPLPPLLVKVITFLLLPDLSVFSTKPAVTVMSSFTSLLLLIIHNILHLLLFSNSTTCVSERLLNLQNFVPVLKYFSLFLPSFFL